MKLKNALVWSALGMAGSSATAMTVPLEARTHSGPPAPTILGTALPGAGTDAAQPRFHDGRTLALDARLGHTALRSDPSGGADETFLLASVSGADRTGSVAPMNVALILDRSGSMRGARMTNAVAAATGIVERMRDGDRITVVAFDDTAQVVVPPTLASTTSRPGIESAIRAIHVGGDTCLSCGLEAAMRALEAARLSPDEVDRAILLSDGAANRGVKDARGLRTLAGRMRDQGCAVSTVGLDVDFDEKVMAAIASESNGHHYFVANAGDLAPVFDRELDALLATVARDAELVVEPAPGVDVVEVFDRAFRREGGRVVIPFGTFGAHQEKTALLRVKVAAGHEGVAPVASLSLTWRDLASRREESMSGALSLRVVPPDSPASEFDPFVAARVARSQTAQTLTDANLLFEQGKEDEARRTLARHARALKLEADKANAHSSMSGFSAPPPGFKALDDDFNGQLSAVAQAESAFGAQPTPPPDSLSNAMRGAGGGAAVAAARPAPKPAAPPAPSSREGKAAVRTNQSEALELLQ
ncbi:MAG TPA: VWA domain-containing protein [Polyangiaceae bacterium]|jgi:Ca-activated chloride channel family protein